MGVNGQILPKVNEVRKVYEARYTWQDRKRLLGMVIRKSKFTFGSPNTEPYKSLYISDHLLRSPQAWEEVLGSSRARRAAATCGFLQDCSRTCGGGIHGLGFAGNPRVADYLNGPKTARRRARRTIPSIFDAKIYFRYEIKQQI